MYFTIRRNADDKFWWRAVGDNNEIMAVSELLESKQACKNAIAVVRNEASEAVTYDKTDEVSKR